MKISIVLSINGFAQFQLWKIPAYERRLCRSTRPLDHLLQCVHTNSWQRKRECGRHAQQFGSGVHLREYWDPAQAKIAICNCPFFRFQLDDLTAAEVYLNEAIQMARKYPEMFQTGIYHANLGLLYLRKSLLPQAQSSCSLARRMAKESDSPEGTKQANYCIDQIKAQMGWSLWYNCYSFIVGFVFILCINYTCFETVLHFISQTHQFALLLARCGTLTVQRTLGDQCFRPSSNLLDIIARIFE